MRDRTAYWAARHQQLKLDPVWRAKRRAQTAAWNKANRPSRTEHPRNSEKEALYLLRRKAREEAARAGMSVIEVYRFHGCLLPKDLVENG